MNAGQRRMGGAVSVSIAGHLVLLVLAIALATMPPASAAAPEPPIPLNLVYLSAPGPSGGGGGRPAPAPARSVQVPRHEVTAPVPVDAPAPPADRPAPVLDVNIATSADVLQIAGRSGVTLDGGGVGRGPGAGPGVGPGLGPGEGGQHGGGPPRPGDDITPPVPIVQVQPTYTSAAMVAKLQGAVRLSVVVRADGTVGDVRIIQSLDTRYGLDEQAVKAAKAWRFRPGLRHGVSVDVQVVLILEFRLH